MNAREFWEIKRPELRAMCEDGKTVAEMADALETECEDVRRQLRLLDLKPACAVPQQHPRSTISARDQLAIDLRREGRTCEAVAAEMRGRGYSATKNSVISIINRKAPEMVDPDHAPPVRTTMMRLQTLQDQMDQVLRECARHQGHIDRVSSMAKKLKAV